jgi:hypothetical protein
MAGRVRGLSLGSGAQAPDLFGELQELAAQKRSDFEATRRPIRDYADMIPEPGFGPLDFDRFPYLEEPFYSDEVAAAAEVVYVKSTQIGASTGSWRWAAREADQFGRTVIYTFPTQDHVNDFGDERIEPAIEGSEYLRSRIPAHFVHTKKLKRIGRGWLYLRGARSQAGAQSVAAQSIVFDEYDELPPTIVSQFERRLSGARQANKAPRIRRLGVPRLPGGPMDRLWQASDRRRWHVTCPGCEREQPLTWAGNVRWTMPGEDRVFRAGHDLEHMDFETAAIVGKVWRACRDCDASLEGGAILRGRWVATNPGHPVIGFHIQRLMVQDADLETMVKASRKTAAHEVEAFHQNDLGEAFSPAEASLSDADIDRAFGLAQEQITLLEEFTAGIDVASERNLNFRIDAQQSDGTRRAVRIGEARSFSEMREILESHGVMVAVIDGMPERRLARALADALPGRVHLAQFVEPGFEAKQQPDALKFDAEKNMVSMHRTEAFDAAFDAVRSGRSIPTADEPVGWREQMKAPKRIVEYDAKMRARRTYTTPSGLADDYAQTEVYALAATEMWRLRRQVVLEQMAAQVPMGQNELGYRTPALDVLGDELGDTYDPGFGGY